MIVERSIDFLPIHRESSYESVLYFVRTLMSNDDRPAASLEQDHRLLSAIVNASDDAILSKTLDGIITSWNPAAERMFGYTAVEIIGKPKTVLFPPDRLQEEEVILDRLQSGI